MTDIETLKYPIGKFQFKEVYTPGEIMESINIIKNLPAKLITLTGKMSKTQLDTQYREGGWTVRQVVSHIADSHFNSLIRIKLALTEDNPTIKPYNQTLWAELIDSRTAPVEASLKIIEGAHLKMVMILESLSEADLNRTYFHPERNKSDKLVDLIALYGWHSEHHYNHIKQLAVRMGW